MWKVQLIGDASDLKLLAKSFTSQTAWIEASGDEFLLSSSEFEAFEHVDSVREWVEEWLPRLNGANAIVMTSDEGIRAAAVYRYDESGNRSIFICLEPIVLKARVISPTVRIGQADGTELVFHPTDPVREWVEVACNDPAVDEVLKLSVPPFDWTTLYRLYEIVKADTQV